MPVFPVCSVVLTDLLKKMIAVISDTEIEGIFKYQIVLVTGFLINDFYNSLDSTNRSEHCTEMSALQIQAFKQDTECPKADNSLSIAPWWISF